MGVLLWLHASEPGGCPYFQSFVNLFPLIAVIAREFQGWTTHKEVKGRSGMVCEATAGAPTQKSGQTSLHTAPSAMPTCQMRIAGFLVCALRFWLRAWSLGSQLPETYGAELQVNRAEWQMGSADGGQMVL